MARGGPRVGAGRKPKSAAERLVDGNAGRRPAVVLPMLVPAASSVLTIPMHNIAPLVDIAAPPAGLTPEALAVWAELAPEAVEKGTLAKTTLAAFVMLCRAVAAERAYWGTIQQAGADHRGLMQRVGSWLKDFGLAPFGKPIFEAHPEKPANPLEKFLKRG